MDEDRRFSTCCAQWKAPTEETERDFSKESTRMSAKLVGYCRDIGWQALQTKTSTNPNDKTPSNASFTLLDSEQSILMANTWAFSSLAISSANLDNLPASSAQAQKLIFSFFFFFFELTCYIDYKVWWWVVLVPKSRASMATVQPSWANLRAMDRPSLGPTPTIAAMPRFEPELAMLRIFTPPPLGAATTS